MWTVTSKTRKAIPGLAKILLAVILLGTILFAVYVQTVKRGLLTLDLDTPLKIPADSGLITLDISSKWQKISAVSDSGEMKGVWEMSAKADTAEGFLYINLLKSHLRPELQIIRIARQNFWMDRIAFSTMKIAENRENDLAFPDFDTEALFVDPSGKMILSMKVLYLPNGSTLALSIITPESRQFRGGYWLEELARTVKFLPAGPLRQVDRGEKLELDRFIVSVPAQAWTQSEANLETLRFQPVTSETDELWEARIRVMPLPEFRQPAELLEDHFFKWYDPDRKIAAAPPEKREKFTLYQAEASSDGDEDRQPIELAWLARWPGNLAVFATLTTPPRSRKKAETFIRNVLDTMSLREEPAAPIAQVDPRTFLASETIFSLADDLAGWYLIESEGRPIGFQAVALAARQPQLRVVAFAYLEDDALTYHEEEQWNLTGDLAEGGYLSRFKARIDRGSRSENHLIVHQNEFTPNAVRILAKLDALAATQDLPRPVEFLPDGADDLLVRLMGSSRWQGPETVLVAQSVNLKPRLQAVLLKRIAGPDGNRQIIVSTDYDNEYHLHRFDREGRWLGYTTSGDFGLRRAELDEVQQRYPRIVPQARQKLAAMAQSMQPNQPK